MDVFGVGVDCPRKPNAFAAPFGMGHLLVWISCSLSQQLLPKLRLSDSSLAGRVLEVFIPAMKEIQQVDRIAWRKEEEGPGEMLLKDLFLLHANPAMESSIFQLRLG